MIRTTLTAVPQRGSVLAANATIFALVTFAVSAVATLRRSSRPKPSGYGTNSGIVMSHCVLHSPFRLRDSLSCRQPMCGH